MKMKKILLITLFSAFFIGFIQKSGFAQDDQKSKVTYIIYLGEGDDDKKVFISNNIIKCWDYQTACDAAWNDLKRQLDSKGYEYCCKKAYGPWTKENEQEAEKKRMNTIKEYKRRGYTVIPFNVSK